MRRIAPPLAGALSAAALLSLAGCQSIPSRVLSVIGLSKQPLVLALATENRPTAALEPLNPFPPYAALQKALSDELQRPVALEMCFPFQIGLGLNSGLYNVAVVDATEYARLSKTEAPRVLAVSVDKQGHFERSAVLVVAAGSPIRNVSELRSKVVAFGPLDDARTHLAALQLLQHEGLAKTDLSLELLPVPGSLKHMPNGRAVVQSIMNGSLDAGFVDEADWDALPERAAQTDEPDRSRLRGIARTCPVPDRIVVASPKLAADVADRVHTFCVTVGSEHPDAVKPLGIAGYQLPDMDVIEAWRKLILPGESQAAPSEEPAPAVDRPAEGVARPT
jgi:ABC-type phosphate/phosphonate transport system substrate-binding protein